MPEKSYQYLFGQPHRYEVLAPLSEEKVEKILVNSFMGISIEIAFSNIEAGYLFHIKKVGNDVYQLYSYKGEIFPTELNLSSLTRFINHSTGLQFDYDAWLLSGEINRKFDVVNNKNDDVDDEDGDDESDA